MDNIPEDLKDIECRNVFCIHSNSIICTLYDRKSQLNKCLAKRRFDKIKNIDKISAKEMNEIVASKKEFDNGERVSYEEVFGHAQPGLPEHLKRPGHKID